MIGLVISSDFCKYVHTIERKVAGELASVYTHLHHICIRRQLMCESGQLVAWIDTSRKKFNLLDSVRAVSYHPLAFLCFIHQYSAFSVPLFYQLSSPNMAQDIGKINGKTKKLAIFASGTGTNAAKLIEHFRENPHGEITLVVCNKPGAGVIQIAENQGIEVLSIEKEQWFRGDGYVDELKKRGIEYLILAGFLWKIPSSVIQNWPGKILNIHPALLPKYGGKGMYGKHVHEAVLAAGDKESGITIHVVDEQYDHGPTVFQVTCSVLTTDNADTLASRIHELEHRYYPEIVETYISK